MTITEDGRRRRLRVPLKVLLRDFERFLGQMAADLTAKEEAAGWLKRVRAEENLDEPPQEGVLNTFVRLCVRGKLQPLLSAYQIPHPSYNYFEDFSVNAKGPWDSTPQKWEVLTPAAWSVLGFDVGFPIGVPASVLTSTADWIDYYARRGFNILTYKTVRSKEREAHQPPNWVFLQGADMPFSPEAIPDHVNGDLTEWPHNSHAFSMANSFGVPSFAPHVWQHDVAVALKCLRSDQLLIVSVMGTEEEYKGDEIVKDFARVAKMAEDAGAQAIELNLSCPNTVDSATGNVKETLICESPDDTARIVRAVRAELRKETRLVIKLSFMLPEKLRAVVVPLAKEKLIDAVSGINTLPLPVRTAEGKPTFPGRTQAGISGIAIRDLGIRFVRSLAEIRQNCGLVFDIIGMGGVMDATDVEAYQLAGATAVQTATAAFFNPELPQDIYRRIGGAGTPERELEIRSRILELLGNGPMTLRELAEHLEEFFQPERIMRERTRAILKRLEEEQMVFADREQGKVLFHTRPAAMEAVAEPSR